VAVVLFSFSHLLSTLFTSSQLFSVLLNSPHLFSTLLTSTLNTLFSLLLTYLFSIRLASLRLFASSSSRLLSFLAVFIFAVFARYFCPFFHANFLCSLERFLFAMGLLKFALF
jgi:hypothetical protein